MVRTHQTARKCCGSKIHCSYLRRKPTRVASPSTNVETSSSSSDSEPEPHLPDPNDQPVPITIVETVFAQHGVEYAHTVKPAANLPAQLLAALNRVKGGLRFDNLNQALRCALTGQGKLYQACRLENYGQQTFSLYARAPIKGGDPILAYGGHLHLRSGWDKLHPDTGDMVHLWTFDIPSDRLEWRGCKGTDLVLAGDLRGNEGRWLHDPAWHVKAWPPKPNVYADVICTTAPSHPDQVLPYAVFYAERDIQSGEELLLYWGDACWEALSKHQTHAQAGESWRAHFELQLLQRYVQVRKAQLAEGPGGSAAGGGLDPAMGLNAAAAVADESCRPATTRRWRLKLVPDAKKCGGGAPGNGTAAVPKTAAAAAGSAQAAAAAGTGASGAAGVSKAGGPEAGYITGSAAARAVPAAAAAATTPKYQAVVFDRQIGRYTSSEDPAPDANVAPVLGPSRRLPPATLAFRRLSQEDLLAAFPGYRPQPSFQGLRPRLRAAMDRTPRRKRRGGGSQSVGARERALIAGGELDGCVVAEVRALHHPVRWATPAQWRAYSVLADRVIAKEEPLGIYSGEVRTAHAMDLIGKPEREAYSFAISAQQLAEVRPQVKWPEGGLVVDALEHGNMARFINDVWGHHRDREPNVEARVVWDEESNRPYVMLYAIKRIRKGQELVMSYGSSYWIFFARHLQLLHHRFYDRTTTRKEALQQWVRQEEGEARLAEVAAAVSQRVRVAAKKLHDEDDAKVIANMLSALGCPPPQSP